MNPFEELCTDEIFILRADSSKTGPYKSVFESNKVTIFDKTLDVDEGEKVLRQLPNGKVESSTILEVHFSSGFKDIPACYDLKIRKDSPLLRKMPPNTTNIHINNSQDFQIGDHNIRNMIKLFISHSSKDQKLVEKLIELIKNALRLPSNEIRCTTIDGHRLPGGANTNEQLKCEVSNTKTFIGLISFSAIDSMYVLFELGARWGADKHLLPLLAPGVSSDILKSPLSGLNALSCSSASQLHQLVNDLAKELEIEPEAPQAYQRYIDEILATTLSMDKNTSIANQVEPIAPYKPTDVQIRIMKAVSDMNKREATVAKVAKVIDLSDMEAKYNLDELSREPGLLNWTGNMNQDVPDHYTLTHKGLGFVLSLKIN